MGTKHLKKDDRQRIRTLYFDAKLTQREIEKITGYSESQVRTAIAAPSAEVGARPGRPQKLSEEEQEELVA